MHFGAVGGLGGLLPLPIWILRILLSLLFRLGAETEKQAFPVVGPRVWSAEEIIIYVSDVTTGQSGWPGLSIYCVVCVACRGSFNGVGCG